MANAARQLVLPPARPGRVIGLLGGSFDPPHMGHVHITREALKLFGLDAVWWLVSPGNPLKARGPAQLERRMAAAREIMQHPRVHISDAEAQIGARYTARTLAALQTARPDVHFVWLMGADNMVQFHLWQDWRQIMQTVPIGILARPGARLAARASVAARVYEHARVPLGKARMLGRMEAPAWCFANVPMMALSSTRLRASGAW
ncbi:nicotinate-nucleotide adenylyltransferase [Roseovarius nanhaiticus]|uniref:Probable nicotinate-nucleotide adenylyltransferase n=1 Tax=Roseovarius nanhaiticus TaxID=573024 RepID=A0A1N7FKY6_9RHOB|nr:nicotinate-nucleotide adenylyltransferase [Roseovarius nanhaiticus]SEK52117.1 nicotinate-nucleotide adenylyltransferase [Roseovarius nanhaiticus]SIS00934.1 nicotinate-nucleotide adenylyltransferase [Roseovarius nanhaiticus]